MVKELKIYKKIKRMKKNPQNLYTYICRFTQYFSKTQFEKIFLFLSIHFLHSSPQTLPCATHYYCCGNNACLHILVDRQIRPLLRAVHAKLDKSTNQPVAAAMAAN